VRFLIDECLTVDLVSVAGQAGHDAQHVAHIGKAGWKDGNVVRYARDGDFVLVTNNASDFRRLYAAQPLYAGLVISFRPIPKQPHRADRYGARSRHGLQAGAGVFQHSSASRSAPPPMRCARQPPSTHATIRPILPKSRSGLTTRILPPHAFTITARRVRRTVRRSR
jgi:hypothetical protein